MLLGSATGPGEVINTSAADLTLFRSQAPGYQLRGYMDDFALFGASLPTSRMDELAALAYASCAPWLTLSEGTAARNGTNDHTITFSPVANGSLLVAIIGGQVTHTMVSLA